MKRIMLSAIAIALGMTSCQKSETTDAILNNGEGAKVEISFASPVIAPEGRAFGSGATEVWEKTVNNATLFVADPAGKIVLKKVIDKAALTASSTTPIPVVVPGVNTGDECMFAMVINNTAAANTKDELLKLLESAPTEYNGTFTEVTTTAKRAGGFVMTGVATKAITAGTTAVAITVKRNVAKVEFEGKTTAAFTTAYGSAKIKINNVSISKASTDTYLFDRTAETTNKYSAGAKTFTFAQDSKEVAGTPNAYQNLFYIYENDVLAAGSRVALTITGIFDNDGNLSTVNDQSPVTYNVELTGEGTGKILRNGAYKVNASINGLTGSDITVSVTIANWETLKTQSVSLGQ